MLWPVPRTISAHHRQQRSVVGAVHSCDSIQRNTGYTQRQLQQRCRMRTGVIDAILNRNIKTVPRHGRRSDVRKKVFFNSSRTCSGRPAGREPSRYVTRTIRAPIGRYSQGTRDVAVSACSGPVAASEPGSSPCGPCNCPLFLRCAAALCGSSSLHEGREPPQQQQPSPPSPPPGQSFFSAASGPMPRWRIRRACTPCRHADGDVHLFSECDTWRRRRHRRNKSGCFCDDGNSVASWRGKTTVCIRVCVWKFPQFLTAPMGHRLHGLSLTRNERQFIFRKCFFFFFQRDQPCEVRRFLSGRVV